MPFIQLLPTNKYVEQQSIVGSTLTYFIFKGPSLWNHTHRVLTSKAHSYDQLILVHYEKNTFPLFF